MNINEHAVKSPQPTALEAFSDRQFTLELNGFELCALAFIAGKLGGVGKLRSVFSEGAPKGHNNYLLAHLEAIPGLNQALNELENAVTVDPDNHSIYVDDNLDGHLD